MDCGAEGSISWGHFVITNCFQKQRDFGSDWQDCMMHCEVEPALETDLECDDCSRVTAIVPYHRDHCNISVPCLCA